MGLNISAFQLSFIRIGAEVKDHLSQLPIINGNQLREPNLFDKLAFVNLRLITMSAARWLRSEHLLKASRIKKFHNDQGTIINYTNTKGRSCIYYTRKLSHFVQILDFVPILKDDKGHKREPSELKHICSCKQPRKKMYFYHCSTRRFSVGFLLVIPTAAILISEK